MGTGLRMIIDDQMRFGAGVIYEEETDLENSVTDTTRFSAYFHDNFEVAENINFKSKDFLSQISKLDKSKPVLLYCSAGGRSAKASIIFDSLGFKEIYDLKGGYLSW